MNELEYIACPELPEPPNASWSNVLKIRDEVHVSGVHAHPHTKEKELDAYEQASIIFDRLQHLLSSAGGGLHNIYKLVVYVTTPTCKDGVNRARAERFGPQVYPCSTLIIVSGFAFPEVTVEIDAWSNLKVDQRKAEK